MKNLKKVSCIVLMIILAGTLITYIRVHGLSTFEGTVEDCSDHPISGASVVLADCYYDIIGYGSTNSEGYYNFDVTLNGNTPYYLTAGKTRYNPDTETVYDEGEYNFELVGIAEKIVVFFWASDVLRDDFASSYKDILEDEGYTKFFEFKDSSNVASSCQTVDAYEHDQDTIFVYIMGHGENSGTHSCTYFKANLNSIVYSNTFRNYLNVWEAPRICILVDSCQAGDWADDFAASPYFAMASSNETTSAYSYNNHTLPWEGQFSHWFFYAIDNGYYDLGAFNYACINCTFPAQYPKLQDYSSYVWFN